MRERVKALWKLCFPKDSDDFVELYFSSRYTDDINSAIIENDRIVSALQRIPYPMRYVNQVIPVAYISGACTHPDFRSRGLMSRLLDEAHRKMYTDGKYLSLLIPAGESLVDYYAKSGYEVCFQQEEKLLTGKCKTVDNFKCDLIFSELDLLKNGLDDVCDFINQQLSTHWASILHPLQDMKIVLSDLQLSGGQAWCVRTDDGMLCGVALVIPVDGEVIIKELLAVDNQVEDAIIDFIFRHYSVSRAEKLSPCGMVRVINAFGMLGAIARTIENKLAVEIYGDDVITGNNGLYVISDGVCRKTETVPEYSRDADVSYQRIHISSLPSWLFRDMQPYMSLMLD